MPDGRTSTTRSYSLGVGRHMSDAVQFIRSGNGLRLSYGASGSYPLGRVMQER